MCSSSRRSSTSIRSPTPGCVLRGSRLEHSPLNRRSTNSPMSSASIPFKLADTPVMAGGSNQTVTLFAAVQAAVENIHRELLKLAQERPGSSLADAKYDDLEARDAGLYRKGEKNSGETYTEILRGANQDS